MAKKYVILIIFIIIVGISGCTTKTAQNGTFGEKNVSIDAIHISNNTTSSMINDTKTGLQYYYITGYLINGNSNDALNVKITATAYDSNGNVIATNNSAYINPQSIPAKGVSRFYVDFPDNDNNIDRYDIKVNSAHGTF